jgi:TolB-like protein/DNA-binding winged helix-turn-helix (wHTH) protein
VPVTIFEFGDFRLDCNRFELWRAGVSMKLERKPMELLILLTTREGDLVTRTEIAERLWGNEVFVDTEHGINTAIRKVRHALHDDPEQPRFVQTVMGRGYRFIGPAVKVQSSPAMGNGHIAPPNGNLPEPAAFAASPASVSPVDTLSGDPAAPSRPHLRLWLAVGASVALLLLIVTLTLRAHSARARRNLAATPNIHSLAVLPLDNLSGDPAQNYFADGMTDELTTMLAKNSTLRITSRTSAMQYKGAHRPLREIAQALGVDGILEGSVERTDGKVHMTIQLIQADTDTHLWAESYDRNSNDVVTLPEEAAQAIAQKLNSAVPAAAPARYVNPEAHDAYLHGRYLWFVEQNEKAAEYFRKATELQPDYAPGWTGLADYYAVGVIEGNFDPRTALPAQNAAARKAIALDDSLPQAHLSLAATYWMYNWDLARADRETLRAIELDPKFAEAYHLRAKFLGMLNRHPEAIVAQKKSMELDPFARPWAMALIYFLARQCDAALTDATQRLESTPDNPGLHEMLSWAYQCKGKQKEAMQERERCLTLSGDNTSAENVRRAYTQGGYNAVLHWQIRDLEHKSSSQYVSPFLLANLYGQLGQRKKTLALLEDAYRQHSPLLFDIQNDPAFDFLHKDERYRTLVQKIGLPPAW